MPTEQDARAKRSELYKIWYLKNKVAVLTKQKIYRDSNKTRVSNAQKLNRAPRAEKLRSYGKRWRAQNKSRIKIRDARWKRLNRPRINATKRKWRARMSKENTAFRLLHNLRSRLRQAIVSRGGKKCDRTIALLGCSIGHFAKRLEAQFLPGMTWENHGLHGWHIDHIKPCAKFDLCDPLQQKACFHYSNLQPLWAADNLEKSAKWAS